MTVPFCVHVCTCLLRDGRRHLVSSLLSFRFISETEPSLKLELANQVEWLARESPESSCFWDTSSRLALTLVRI